MTFYRVNRVKNFQDGTLVVSGTLWEVQYSKIAIANWKPCDKAFTYSKAEAEVLLKHLSANNLTEFKTRDDAYNIIRAASTASKTV